MIGCGQRKGEMYMLKKILVFGGCILTTFCGIGYDFQKNKLSDNSFEQKIEKKEISKNKKSTENVEKNIKDVKEQTETVEKNSSEQLTEEGQSNNENSTSNEQQKVNSSTQQFMSPNEHESVNNSADQQPKQAPVPTIPKTEWERLGISEYDYYNTPMFTWEERAYSNINDCMNEASSINQRYGFVTNYGYVSGKYVDTIGCWVKVYVNGNKYYLSAFKALGY